MLAPRPVHRSYRQMPHESTPAVAPSCRGWSKRIFIRRISTWPELQDLDIKYPVEYVTLLAAANSRLALECGYTAARSGGSLFNIDVWLKKAIEEGLTTGPRLPRAVEKSAAPAA